MRGSDDALFGIGAGCEGAMLVVLERAGSHSRAEKALAQTFTDTPSSPQPLIITIYESQGGRESSSLPARPGFADLVARDSASPISEVSHNVVGDCCQLLVCVGISKTRHKHGLAPHR
jgi:hypothetical protein